MVHDSVHCTIHTIHTIYATRAFYFVHSEIIRLACELVYLRQLEMRLVNGQTMTEKLSK